MPLFYFFRSCCSSHPLFFWVPYCCSAAMLHCVTVPPSITPGPAAREARVAARGASSIRLARIIARNL